MTFLMVIKILILLFLGALVGLGLQGIASDGKDGHPATGVWFGVVLALFLLVLKNI